ncbi:MAG: YggS family pyridoxal phosphate-dependent enzyme [Caldisericia bacterium]|nr:YggS family pyridoxal phosphate-dependent enzyme [Caldisericia bacterium]
MINKEAISNNLKIVHENISNVATKSHRVQDEIKLMCVSKKATMQNIIDAIDCGEKLFGENYTQNAIPKIQAISQLTELKYSNHKNDTLENSNDIYSLDYLNRHFEFSFIGHLQKNKVTKVLEHFSRIDSVDSVSLASTISSHYEKISSSKAHILTIKPYPILLEVKTSKDESKFGILPEVLPFLIESIQEFENIQIEGFMTMATNTQDEKEIRRCFSLLKSTQEKMVSKFQTTFPVLSMGMSNDYEYAIKEGSTLLRIGSAIFGG